LKAEFNPVGRDDVVFEEIKSTYNMKAHAFNSGVMAFSTDIIKDDSLSILIDLFYKYVDIVLTK
jgi:hypothetical protein